MASIQQAFRKPDAHSDAIWCVEWLSETLLLTGGVDGHLKCWKVSDKMVVELEWEIDPGEFPMGVVSICRLSYSYLYFIQI